MHKYSMDIQRKNPNPDLSELAKQRKILWRRQHAINRVERPLRLKRARTLGYKAKQGFVIVRVRVRRGGLRKPRPHGGRRPRHMGSKKFVPAKSMQLIAEERAGKAHRNLEVLNSYWVGEDGQHKWFEIILVDPDHPSILADKDINWICDPSQSGRAHRGLTSSGRKVRGLRH